MENVAKKMKALFQKRGGATSYGDDLSRRRSYLGARLGTQCLLLLADTPDGQGQVCRYEK